MESGVSMKQLTAEGVKIQLNEMYRETVAMFEGVKAKVRKILIE